MIYLIIGSGGEEWILQRPHPCDVMLSNYINFISVRKKVFAQEKYDSTPNHNPTPNQSGNS